MKKSFLIGLFNLSVFSLAAEAEEKRQLRKAKRDMFCDLLKLLFSVNERRLGDTSDGVNYDLKIAGKSVVKGFGKGLLVEFSLEGAQELVSEFQVLCDDEIDSSLIKQMLLKFNITEHYSFNKESVLVRREVKLAEKKLLLVEISDDCSLEINFGSALQRLVEILFSYGDKIEKIHNTFHKVEVAAEGGAATGR